MKKSRLLGAVCPCVSILGMALPGVALCNELQNASFETDVDDLTLSSGLPNQFSVWSGDQSSIGGAEQEISPIVYF